MANVVDLQRYMQRVGRKLGGPEQLILHSFLREAEDPWKQEISKHVLNLARASFSKNEMTSNINITGQRLESKDRLSTAELDSINRREDLSNKSRMAIKLTDIAGAEERQGMELGAKYQMGMDKIKEGESEIYPKLALGGAKIAIDYGTAERKRQALKEQEAKLDARELRRKEPWDYEGYGGVR